MPECTEQQTGSLQSRRADQLQAQPLQIPRFQRYIADLALSSICRSGPGAIATRIIKSPAIRPRILYFIQSSTSPPNHVFVQSLNSLIKQIGNQIGRKPTTRSTITSRINTAGNNPILRQSSMNSVHIQIPRMTLCSCSRRGSATQLRGRVLQSACALAQILEYRHAEQEHNERRQKPEKLLAVGGIEGAGKQADAAYKEFDHNSLLK